MKYPKYLLFILLTLLVYATLSAYLTTGTAVTASGYVKVYRVVAVGDLGSQDFIPFGTSHERQARNLEASDVIGFSCTSSQGKDTCYVLAK